MSKEKENTICLFGEVCEIVHDPGKQVRVKVLCKSECLFFESSALADVHLGEKVYLTLKYEARSILPITNQANTETN